MNKRYKKIQGRFQNVSENNIKQSVPLTRPV